jgi:predicted RNA-binding Zn-ribbon protein involved in translation (DUF1610 family)
LELRFLIEAHVYQRLLREIDDLPRTVINTWQASKAVRLHAKFDKYADMDMHLLLTGPSGESMDIHYNNIKYSELNKIYNALGSFLHLPMPEKVGNYTIDRSKIIEFLGKLERLTTGNAIVYKIDYKAFCCAGCGKNIIYTDYYVETNSSIVCQNDNCSFEYAIINEGGHGEFSLDYKGVTCHVCTNQITVPFGKIEDGYKFKCGSCSTEFRFELIIRSDIPRPE